MKQKFFEQPKENFMIDDQICLMEYHYLFCTCGYKERLAYKGRDFCFECGTITIDITESLIASHLQIQNGTFYQQNFYQLSIEHDYEINNADVFIDYRYELNFDSITYTLTMKKFIDEELVLRKEESFFNQKYNNSLKMFDSGIIPLPELKEPILQHDDDEEEIPIKFTFTLGTEFPSFVHNWLYYIFTQRSSYEK